MCRGVQQCRELLEQLSPPQVGLRHQVYNWLSPCKGLYRIPAACLEKPPKEKAIKRDQAKGLPVCATWQTRRLVVRFTSFLLARNSDLARKNKRKDMQRKNAWCGTGRLAEGQSRGKISFRITIIITRTYACKSQISNTSVGRCDEKGKEDQAAAAEC